MRCSPVKTPSAKGHGWPIHYDRQPNGDVLFNWDHTKKIVENLLDEGIDGPRQLNYAALPALSKRKMPEGPGECQHKIDAALKGESNTKVLSTAWRFVEHPNFIGASR
jgi:hypothetical protein